MTGDSLRPGLKAGYALAREDLQPVTAVPVRVPAAVWGTPADDSLYVVVQQARANRYALTYSPDPACSGGSVCRAASVAGEHLSSRTAPPAGRAVTIEPGQVGTFVAGTCGAGCSDALLWWDDGRGNRYWIGLKQADAAHLIRMARSMHVL